MFSDPTILLMAIIAVIAVSIGTVLCATVYRRAARVRKYRNLDRDKARYGVLLRDSIKGENLSEDLSPFVFQVGSPKWHAVEHVLSELAEEPGYAAGAFSLFDKLGYRSHYEGRLGSRDVITKTSAVNKLGRMRCGASTGKLVPLLDEQSVEIVPVTVRALGTIGTAEALESLLERLPGLHARSRVTKKSIETSLWSFGPVGVPTLIHYGERYTDPASRASVLEVLASLKAREALDFAIENLGHADSEVRAKALKVIGAANGGLPDGEKDRVLPLLDDPVWFVRLKAVKALGNLKHAKAGVLLAKRLVDENWQVRNAAATAVIAVDEKPIDIFLDSLGHTDRYAKESVCEEIQKTGFVYRLIDNLGSTDREVFGKSRDILKIMGSLGYGTPLREYADTGPDARIRKELALLLLPEEGAR
jgi:hypothetical protein